MRQPICVAFSCLSTDLGIVTEIIDGAPGRDQKPDRVYPSPA